MKKEIWLCKHIHSCFAAVSIGDVWLYRFAGEKPKSYEQKVVLPNFIIFYLESDKTFYDLGLEEEFKVLVDSYIQEGWAKELPLEAKKEENEYWEEQKIKSEERRKKRGCVLIGKGPFKKEDYKGGFTDKVFYQKCLQNYISDMWAFGYIGHVGRTWKMDIYLEKKFMSCIDPTELDFGAALLALWLTSTDGRHNCDSLEDMNFLEQKKFIDLNIESILEKAIKYFSGLANGQFLSGAIQKNRYEPQLRRISIGEEEND